MAVEIQVAEDGKDVHDYKDGFIIAGDGVYEKRTDMWMSHLTKVDEISELPKLKEDVYLKLTMPKLPFSIIIDVWNFFRKVNEEENAEAIVALTYDEKEYGLAVPSQEVSGASVDYKLDDIINVIGTIHSHNTMAAFHSGTDDADESKMDGIHITLGNVDESFPSISCSVTKNNQRFMIRLPQLFDFTKSVPGFDLKSAMKKVKSKTFAVSKGINTDFKTDEFGNFSGRRANQSYFNDREYDKGSVVGLYGKSMCGGGYE